MKNVNIPFTILCVMLSSIIFALGRTYGYIQCRDKYQSDYEYQRKRIDSLANQVEAYRIKKIIEEQNNKNQQWKTN